MKPALVVGYVLCATALLSTNALAQSLAEIARQEKARRAAITEKAKVYTNDDLRGGGRLTTGSSRPDSPVAPDPERGAADAALETGEAGGVGDEASWRARITAAREGSQRADLMAAALQNRVDGLWAEFTAMDDPAQRALVEQERIEALNELENVQGELERLDQEIRDIEEDARQAGVPPGWLR